MRHLAYRLSLFRLDPSGLFQDFIRVFVSIPTLPHGSYYTHFWIQPPTTHAMLWIEKEGNKPSVQDFPCRETEIYQHGWQHTEISTPSSAASSDAWTVSPPIKRSSPFAAQSKRLYLDTPTLSDETYSAERGNVEGLLEKSQASCLSILAWSKLAFTRESLHNGFQPTQGHLARVLRLDYYGIGPFNPFPGWRPTICQFTPTLEGLGTKESSWAPAPHTSNLNLVWTMVYKSCQP